MISAIVFDYDGVIEINEINIFQAISDYLNISREELSKAWNLYNHLCNVHNMDFPDVMLRVLRELNASESQISHINKLISSRESKMNHELIEIIKSLRSKNYKIGLLSNYTTALRQRLIDKNLVDLFDAVIISGEVGYQKPQPEIFKVLFDELGVQSRELVFIDDTKRSLEGAENIGYTPILFTNNEKLKEVLNVNGIIF